MNDAKSLLRSLYSDDRWNWLYMGNVCG